MRSAIRPILALVLMVLLAGADGAAARERTRVVVAAQPGERAAAQRLVERLGGTVEQPLPLLRGFVARVPEEALGRLSRARSVRLVARDVPLRLSTETGAVSEPSAAEPTGDADEPSAAEAELPPAIEAPPAEVATDETAARAVIAEGAEEAAVGSLEPDPVVPGEDVPEGLSEPAEPVELAPDDPGAQARASLDAIRAQAGAAGLGLTGAGVDVALIDSGVIGLGPLAGAGKLVRGPDFSEDAYDPDLRGLDTFGHGSHMAGVIAGDDPATGYRGIAPGARLVSVKVSGADGLTSLVRVLLALDWVRSNRASNGLRIRVLNLSLGVDSQRSYVREPLAYAAEALWRRGIVVVAAAGNQAESTFGLDLPAADPFLLAVGASDGDTVADFSSRDAKRPPDVVAPGVRVISARVPGSTLDEEFPLARIGESYFRGSGTSQAAAVVSGLAALALEARPELTPDQLKALLRAGAHDLPDDVSADGAGRVDLGAALALATPSPEAAAQPFTPAQLDLYVLWTQLFAEARGEAPAIGTGENGWTGRRWSGRRWSGRRWSGRRWSSTEWGEG